MAKINNPPPPNNAWPWGPPASVRERLVGLSQLDRRAVKKGNAKKPQLASVALLKSLEAGDSSDELRFSMPPLPPGHDADLNGFQDRSHLLSLSHHADEALDLPLEASLDAVRATPERRNRLRALLDREAPMLELLRRMYHQVREVEERRRAEQRSGGEI